MNTIFATLSFDALPNGCFYEGVGQRSTQLGREDRRGRTPLGRSNNRNAFRTRVRTTQSADDSQRALKVRAEQVVAEVAQARWLGFEEAATSIPTAFLVVLVSWLAAMFAGFALFSPRNATALTALLIGALAVSTSIFLIEEMGRPLHGYRDLQRTDAQRPRSAPAP